MPSPTQPTPLDYASPTTNKPGRGLPVFLWIVVAVIATALSVSMLLPSLSGRSRPLSNRVKCASNLKQIGNAMLLYSLDHGGRYPDGIEGLLEEDITTPVFICPQTNDSPAKAGPTTKATAANVESGGHLSYVYIGKGMMNSAPADVVVAYEPLANHQNTGMNVLYGDLHVEYLPVKDATWMLSELKAGYNPPRDPTKVKGPTGKGS